MRFRWLFILCVFLLVACQQQEETVASSGKVYPSVAFLQHFGEPPLPKEGYAYAQVGYLPLADRSGKVLPIPLFLFNENEHLDRVLSQLFSDRLMASARSGVSLPFAQGVRLTQLDQAGDTLAVFLSLDAGKETPDLAGIERAVVETATQFEDVARVRIFYDGNPAENEPIGGYQSLPGAIAAVRPPILLDIVGVWEEGTVGPHEILLNFDRPVEFNGFRLLNSAGEQIAGSYFTSLFNMAVVVRPQEPESFTEGMILNVSWDVRDQLGRRNSALDSLPLSRSEH